MIKSKCAVHRQLSVSSGTRNNHVTDKSDRHTFREASAHTCCSPRLFPAVEMGLRRAASSLRKRTVNSGSEERRVDKRDKQCPPSPLNESLDGVRGGVEDEREDTGASASSWSGEVEGGFGVGPTEAHGDELDSAGDVDGAALLYLDVARQVDHVRSCM